MEAKDFLRQKILINNKVIFIWKGYRYFRIGKVNKITDQMVFITPDDQRSKRDVIKQFHNQIIVIKD